MKPDGPDTGTRWGRPEDWFFSFGWALLVAGVLGIAFAVGWKLLRLGP